MLPCGAMRRQRQTKADLFPQPEISPLPLSLFFTPPPPNTVPALSSKGSTLTPPSVQLSFPSSYPEHIIHLSGSLGTLSILLCVRFLLQCLCPVPPRPQLLISESYICLCYLGTRAPGHHHSAAHSTLISLLILLLRSCKRAPYHTGTPGPEHSAEARW